MKQEKLDQMLAALGQEIEEEQLFQGAEKHDFSEKYQRRKQELLVLAEQQNKKKTVFYNHIIKRILQTAAVLMIVAGVSFTAYARTKNARAIHVDIKEDKVSQKLHIEVERKKESDEIIVVPRYLPDGYDLSDSYDYEEWEGKGQYSFGGIRAADGISIVESDRMEEQAISYETYEIWQHGNEKKLLVDRGDGPGYRWDMLLFYEKEGHIVEVCASSLLSKEEVLKVGEGLKLCKNKEEFEAAKKDAPKPQKIRLGERIEYSDYAKGCYFQVTDMAILDEVDGNNLSGAHIQYEPEKVDKYQLLAEEGKLKHLKVTVKLENTTEKTWKALPICPIFYDEKKELESSLIPYAFDGSIHQREHNYFYYTEMQPESEKEVHFYFAEEEEVLEKGMLEFFQNYYIKIGAAAS